MVGKHWRSRYQGSSSNLGQMDFDLELKIVARTRVSVPAGDFNAFHIQQSGIMHFNGRGGGTARFSGDIWMAPDVLRRPVMRQILVGAGQQRPFRIERTELVSFNEK